MLESYFPVFVFILIGILFGVAPVVVGVFSLRTARIAQKIPLTNAVLKHSKMPARNSTCGIT